MVACRTCWVWLWLVCLGCHVLLPVEAEEVSPGRGLWEKGQAALREGQPDTAIACYQQSLAADPNLADNHISLAAAYLEKGEEAQALPHLAAYLKVHPDHLIIRLHYADLLLRLERTTLAREQFERFASDAQDAGPEGRQHLIHCCTRLMEIAELEEDEYGQHLHRGIGLYLLARERAALPDPDGEMSSEELLCKSAGELALARLHRPEEARPCWYLYKVWSRLAQRQPALRWLRTAEELAPFSYLTPAEQRGLQLAWRDHGRALPR